MNGWTMQTSPIIRSSGRRFRHSQGSIAGPWIPQFEELVRYTDREIPRGEGLLLIPGEDPFYYTTGRRPRFPGAHVRLYPQPTPKRRASEPRASPENPLAYR